ncbi:hypothetical protein F8S20_11830 [Nostoc sp. BAE]|nr:hypothetical protein [Nostoc commune BAE]
MLRTVQNANRRETRGNSQTIARLERSIRELGDIARLHQEGLRIAQREAERDRQAIRETQAQAERDRQARREVELQTDRDREVLLASLLQVERDRLAFQEEIRRIWEYLRDRNGGSSTPN